MRTRASILTLATSLVACHFDLGSVAVHDGSDSEDDGGPGGGADAGLLDPTIQNAHCSRAPGTYPAPPAVPGDARGRPDFDSYRDLSCEEAADAPLCEEAQACPSGTPSYTCLRAEGSRRGLCAVLNDLSDLHPVLSFDRGSCLAPATREGHKRACCEGIDGIDCRAWPYPQDSAPGELCARHEDCEPGLVCRAALDQAVCACPDVLPGNLTQRCSVQTSNQDAR